MTNQKRDMGKTAAEVPKDMVFSEDEIERMEAALMREMEEDRADDAAWRGGVDEETIRIEAQEREWEADRADDAAWRERVVGNPK